MGKSQAQSRQLSLGPLSLDRHRAAKSATGATRRRRWQREFVSRTDDHCFSAFVATNFSKRGHTTTATRRDCFGLSAYKTRRTSIARWTPPAPKIDQQSLLQFRISLQPFTSLGRSRWRNCRGASARLGCSCLLCQGLYKLLRVCQIALCGRKINAGRFHPITRNYRLDDRLVFLWL